MTARRKKPDPSLLVQAKDCYDPTDYILIHKDRYAEMAKYEQWWKDARVVSDRIREERDIAEKRVTTLREFAKQATSQLGLSNKDLLPHLKDAMGISK